MSVSCVRVGGVSHGEGRANRVIFPKYRQQEPAQAGPRPVRPHPASRRQPSERAQEVRWSGCPCEIPEVLPLNGLFVLGLIGGGKRSAAPIPRGDHDYVYGTGRIIPSLLVGPARMMNGNWWSDLWSQKGSFARAIWVPSSINAFTHIRTFCLAVEG